MKKVLAVLAGLVLWVVVVSLLNRGLRLGVPGYAAAEPAMTFTLGMKIGRLLIGAAASLAAGAAVSTMARPSTSLPWVLGAILLAAFIPIHIQLWTKFPVWYHLVFLATLAPLVALGAGLRRRLSPHAPR